jgi:hypothetical protein
MDSDGSYFSDDELMSMPRSVFRSEPDVWHRTLATFLQDACGVENPKQYSHCSRKKGFSYCCVKCPPFMMRGEKVCPRFKTCHGPVKQLAS